MALATVGILGRGLGVGTISIAIAVAYAFSPQGVAVLLTIMHSLSPPAVLFFCLVLFKVAQRAAFQHRLGAFWLAYWPVSLSGICVSIWIGGRIGSSPNAMSLIAMIGLLPLINLPFDWASIGLTRALLRRGCEDRGPRLLRSPTLLGLIDFLLGLILLVTLALTLILAFSTADAILLHAGRE